MKVYSIDYYTINAKILPVSVTPEDRYKELIKNWLTKGYKVQTKGDRSHYYTLMKLDEINQGEAYYGVITKFISLKDIDFINTDTGELIEFPLPKNVEGKVNDYEFIFIPKYHRFAFVKTGKIDDTIKKTGAPLKKMTEIIKMAFDNGLDIGGNQNTVVEIAQDSFIFEEIFQGELYNLSIKVSYTNDDLNPEAKEAMDSLLKDGRIAEFYAKLTPERNGTINTDETLPKGLLQLAEENGSFKATVGSPEGVKKINSVDYPAIDHVSELRGNNFIIRIINKIIERFNEKYGAEVPVNNE